MPEVMTHTPSETYLLDGMAKTPGWRLDLRDKFCEIGLPGKRDEDWKWSDWRGALDGRYDAKNPFQTFTDDLFNHTDLVAIELNSDGWSENGLWSSRVGEASGILVGTASITAPAGTSRGAELASSLAGRATEIRFLANERAPALFVGRQEHSVLQVLVEAGASATLLDTFQGFAEAFAGEYHSVRVILEEGASLNHVIVDRDGQGDRVIVADTHVSLAENATYTQTALSFGSQLSRHETHISHAGAGAEADLNAVYLLDEGRHCDFTSHVHHTGPGGITMQLVKGAVAANARGVFQGKFKVDKAAQQTDARMTHRALMLDGRAEIDAKPELEIYADDVQCAHGNAIGALDETALFYMRQRGIPEARARAILIESFLSEPLDNIENEVVRDELRSMLSERLEAMT